MGFAIIKRLTNKPFENSASKVLTITSKPYAEPRWLENGSGEWGPHGKIFYKKPVVVLIGPRTFSAAEDFTVAFDYMKRGKLIGLPTGGSTGQPVPFNLPGGGAARVCGKRDTYPDGKEFVGVGIMPDITVKRTIKDLQNGIDATKNKALEVLNK
ncbi:S41 family peptidase [Mucilaginibacter flavus]|uniref:S41 family peptidase n=1 Tax=Mucilaginibacter flavus TaxID=931504 RepID=UPI0025B2F211|nr:S41 family peptidase [Mucilaginibacter flavus]MDN3584133.1 S41 family peptidase [Mucilaginibacter flavus]